MFLPISYSNLWSLDAALRQKGSGVDKLTARGTFSKFLIAIALSKE